MKIRAVEPLRVGQFLFCRIETDAGLHGVGEGGAWGHLEAAEAAIRKFADYLVGRDPGPIEHHWNVMHRDSYFQGTAINSAISAIDIALWDLKGKALGVPVHQLLGGPVRSRVRVYAHVYEKTIDAVIADCVRKKELGFTALGHLNPFLDEGEEQVYFEPHARKIEQAVENVRRMREAVGADVDLLIELHRRLTPAEAIGFARGIEGYTPMWIEDPIRPEPIDAMARLARRVPVPIATGERFSSLYQFEQLLARGGVEFVRASLCVCGGITGARKIAAIAEAHGAMLAPHNPLSPVCLAASMQLAASIPNFAIQEYPTGFDDMTMVSTATLLGADVVTHVPPAVDGFVEVPSTPGIGTDLRADAAAIRTPVTRVIGMRPHADGFVVDQ